MEASTQSLVKFICMNLLHLFIGALIHTITIISILNITHGVLPKVIFSCVMIYLNRKIYLDLKNYPERFMSIISIMSIIPFLLLKNPSEIIKYMWIFVVTLYTHKIHLID